MPNWCENHLTVKGQTDEVQAFLEAAKGVDDVSGKTLVLSFNALFPQPEGLVGGVCDWRTAHWGTKWETDPSETWDLTEGQAYICFSTAWAPPLGVIERAAEVFPRLHFILEYLEAGCDFSGALELKDGWVREREGTYQESPYALEFDDDEGDAEDEDGAPQ